MKIAPTANSRRQSVDRHGISVTLTNYSKTGEDDYGENYDDGTDHTITARPWSRTRGTEDRDNREAGEVDADRLFVVKDNETGINSISAGAGKGASEITENGTTYYIIRVRENNDGTKTLEGVKD